MIPATSALLFAATSSTDIRPGNDASSPNTSPSGSDAWTATMCDFPVHQLFICNVVIVYVLYVWLLYV